MSDCRTWSGNVETFNELAHGESLSLIWDTMLNICLYLSGPIPVNEMSWNILRRLNGIFFCGISVPTHNITKVWIQSNMSDNELNEIFLRFGNSVRHWQGVFIRIEIWCNLLFCLNEISCEQFFFCCTCIDYWLSCILLFVIDSSNWISTVVLISVWGQRPSLLAIWIWGRSSGRWSHKRPKVNCNQIPHTILVDEDWMGLKFVNQKGT